MSKARQLADNGAATPNRNMIINGAMNVAQRSTSVTGIGANATSYHTLDRWLIETANSAGRFTMTQTADGPSGFANCLKMDCTTADTSIATTEYLLLEYKIEGQDLQRIKKGTADAEQVTISFYVKANAAFNFALEFYDNDNNRTCSKLFSTTTSWNRIELTYPADTTGAFDDDNAASVRLFFWLHAGSDYTSGTLNSSSFNSQNNANRAVGISSFYSSTDNNFFITGVQMEVGSSATPFEHKTFGQDLAESRRYYTTHEFSGQEFVNIEANTATHKFCGFPLPGNMRTTPTVTLPSGMTGGAVSGLTGTVSAVTVTSTQENRCAFRVTMSEATGTARAVHHCDTFDADVATIDAEL